jgi:hypothetical protein
VNVNTSLRVFIVTRPPTGVFLADLLVPLFVERRLFLFVGEEIGAVVVIPAAAAAVACRSGAGKTSLFWETLSLIALFPADQRTRHNI